MIRIFLFLLFLFFSGWSISSIRLVEHPHHSLLIITLSLFFPSAILDHHSTVDLSSTLPNQLDFRSTSTLNLLNSTSYNNSNSTHPMVQAHFNTMYGGSKQSKNDSTRLADTTLYCIVVHAVQYLTLTKPNIQYSFFEQGLPGS